MLGALILVLYRNQRMALGMCLIHVSTPSDKWWGEKVYIGSYVL